MIKVVESNGTPFMIANGEVLANFEALQGNFFIAFSNTAKLLTVSLLWNYWYFGICVCALSYGEEWVIGLGSHRVWSPGTKNLWRLAVPSQSHPCYGLFCILFSGKNIPVVSLLRLSQWARHDLIDRKNSILSVPPLTYCYQKSSKNGKNHFLIFCYVEREKLLYLPGSASSESLSNH